MSLIAVSGKSKAGKDAFALELVENHGYTAVAFATKPKEAARAIWGFTDGQLYGALKDTVDPRFNRTPRAMVVEFATEVMRGHYGPYVWADALLRDLEPGRNYVITDLRFTSEAESVYYRAAKLVRVERPNNPSVLPPELASHPSETELDTWTRWDRVIVNCLDLKHLRAMAAGCASEWKS